MAAARASARVEARPRATMLPGLPMRGNSHLIIFRYGSSLDGIRSIAFLAKGLACSSVCRLSFGSDIHSRMILRRVSCSGFILNPLLLTAIDGRGRWFRSRQGDEDKAASVGDLV